jgi:hypothetical protein
MSSGLIGPEYDGQIRQTIIAVRQMGRVSTEMDLAAQGKAASRFANKQAILLEDLRAAVNTKRDPSTARVAVLRRKANGDLTQSSLILTVVNRFKHISIDAGTYLKIEHIDGEWQPYAADCPSDESSSESASYDLTPESIESPPPGDP